MTLYSASFGTILWRFYAMMGIGIAAFISGYYYLSVLCLPLLLMCMLGISFKSDKKNKVESNTSHHQMTKQMSSQEAA